MIRLMRWVGLNTFAQEPTTVRSTPDLDHWDSEFVGGGTIAFDGMEELRIVQKEAFRLRPLGGTL
jgi:hypothetical protein